MPTTPSRAPKNGQPLSPAPDTGLELHACIGDFLRLKGIDLSTAESSLLELDMTPDIMTEVPTARLCEVTGMVEGRVRKFQVFCKEWCVRLEDKKRHA